MLSVSNNFHPKIRFTYEMEVKSKLAFLDILLHRDGHDIITTVYRKVINSDVYLNWYFFCPREWKRATFRSLVQRVYIICSSSHLPKEELKHLEDEHKHDIIYLATCPEDNCSGNYIGESGRRISERIIDYNGTDQKSHIFKQSSEKCCQHFITNSFTIIGNGFKNNSFKRKVSEAQLIKQIKPSLNVQEKSIELKLFN